MSTILITGGTGTLGKKLVELLESHDVPVSVGSRSNRDNSRKIAVMDLLSGSGVQEAIKGKDTVFHLASDLRRDLVLTHNLLKSLANNTRVHLIYMSIVGIDRVPMNYYRQKLASEIAIEQSGVAYSILRATQFHEFIDKLLAGFLRFPIGMLPNKAISQPIQTEIVAEELWRLSNSAPTSSIDEIGGCESLTFEELARQWLAKTGKKRWVFNLPLRGKLGTALSGGGLTTNHIRADSISWHEWLERKYSQG